MSVHQRVIVVDRLVFWLQGSGVGAARVVSSDFGHRKTQRASRFAQKGRIVANNLPEFYPDPELESARRSLRNTHLELELHANRQARKALSLGFAESITLASSIG